MEPLVFNEGIPKVLISARTPRSVPLDLRSNGKL